MKLFWWLTGGRPMQLDGFAFTDTVVNQPVYYFTDRFGRRWMAHNRWSLFRVRLYAKNAASP